MKFDSFLTSPRWEILQILAQTPSSPIELAEKLGTTVAYMSQQLKLLDAANLVIKTKTGATEKGKPRSIYKLSRDMVYFVSLNSSLVEKKLIKSQTIHDTILKIWMIEDTSLHYYFEKVYWKISDLIGDQDLIFIDNKKPKLIVISNSPKIKSFLDSYVSKLSKEIDYDVLNHSQFKKLDSSNLFSLTNPNLMDNEVKGGNGKL